VINFLVNSILLLAPTSFKNEASIPRTIPTPDFGAEHTQSLKIRVKKARDLQPGKPALFTILNGDADEQAKVDLLTLSVDLLGRFAEMYKPFGAFIEIYAPVLDVLEQVQAHKLSPVFQVSYSNDEWA
jgi:nucleolar protein 14